MDTARYDDWEEAQNEYARQVAQLCLDTFTSGHEYLSFNCRRTKTVTEYVLCKVYQILWGSTPSIGFMSSIKKRGDTMRVYLTLFEQD